MYIEFKTLIMSLVPCLLKNNCVTGCIFPMQIALPVSREKLKMLCGAIIYHHTNRKQRRPGFSTGHPCFPRYQPEPETWDSRKVHLCFFLSCSPSLNPMCPTVPLHSFISSVATSLSACRKNSVALIS